MSLKQAIDAFDKRQEQNLKKIKKRKRFNLDQDTSTHINTINFKFNPTSSIVVGLDVSLSSPGISIWNPSTSIITTYGFSSSVIKKNENTLSSKNLNQQLLSNLHLQSSSVTIQFIELDSLLKSFHIAETTSTNVELRIQRMQTVCDKIINTIIHNNNINNKNTMPIIIGIEGYAYNACGGNNTSKSSSVSILCELGGILRNAFLQKKWRFIEISPTSCKKEFTGFGNATKLDMYTTFKLCWADECDLNIESWISKPKKRTTNFVCHPLEDMIDSFALLKYMLQHYSCDPSSFSSSCSS